jgi:hypothetical protein
VGADYRNQVNRKTFHGQLFLHPGSSGMVSACHRGDLSYGSWDWIPSGFRAVV